jgi:flavin-dependent dehydrogenase
VRTTIVGAGPAGSAAALAVARRGYSVALLDKERFPREKLCGDFLNPASWPLLRVLGVDQGILSHEHEKVTAFRVTSISGDDAEVLLSSKHGEAVFGLGLRRSLLDQVLLEKAGSEGVVVQQGTRLRLLQRETDGWFLEVEHGSSVEELRARVLIGADGRNSWVAHHLGLTGGAAIQGRAVGFQLRLKCANGPRGRVEIHLIPGGYAGLVRTGGDRLNLACAIEKNRLPVARSHFVEFASSTRPQISPYPPFDRAQGVLFQRGFNPITQKSPPLQRGIKGDLTWLETRLSQNPRLQKILRDSEYVGEVRSTYPVYFRPRRACADGVLLVGDAARVSEPVTGEGVYRAMKSGLIAAGVVHEAFKTNDFSSARLSGYERQCRQAFRLRQGMNSLVRWLIYRPGLVDPLIRFSARRKKLLDSIVHAVCQPEAGR